MAAGVIGSIGTEAAAAAVTAPATMHAEPVLAAITLVMTVLAGVLLWLTSAGNKCRQATYILSAFMAALMPP